MSFSWSRILAFLVALAGMLALWQFLTRTYIGTAIRAIAQDRQIMPLMGVDQPQGLPRHLGASAAASRGSRRR